MGAGWVAGSVCPMDAVSVTGVSIGVTNGVGTPGVTAGVWITTGSGLACEFKTGAGAGTEAVDAEAGTAGTAAVDAAGNGAATGA